MTYPTDFSNQADLEQTLVERKLSGIYCRTTVEVPYELFTSLIREMHRVIANEYDVDSDEFANLSEEAMAQNPAVIKYFEDELAKALTLDNIEVGDAWDDTFRVLAKEIKAAKVERDRLEQEAARKHQEAMKHAAEQGHAILVPGEENYLRALQILELAGLIKVNA